MISSNQRRRTWLRSLAVRAAQPFCAAFAAAMARAASARDRCATSAMTPPVAGFVTGNVAPSSASAHSPAR